MTAHTSPHWPRIIEGVLLAAILFISLIAYASMYEARLAHEAIENQEIQSRECELEQREAA